MNTKIHRRSLLSRALLTGSALGLSSLSPAALAPSWGDDLSSITRDELAQQRERREIVATFSIVACDPEHGEVGAAVASMYPSVGRVVPYVKAGIGAFCTQHYHVPKWGEPALGMLREGKRPERVLAELLESDPQPGARQLAIVNMKGEVAVHNPDTAPKESSYWGAQTGKFYSCQGNTLTGREVIAGMAAAYEATEGSLADRLMAALLAGDCAGGDHRGRLAAGIRVDKVREQDEAEFKLWLDLQVDRSDDAVIELAEAYAKLEHEAKGAWRGGKLPFQHPCKERPEPAPPTR